VFEVLTGAVQDLDPDLVRQAAKVAAQRLGHAFHITWREGTHLERSLVRQDLAVAIVGLTEDEAEERLRPHRIRLLPLSLSEQPAFTDDWAYIQADVVDGLIAWATASG
jgi:hypothetical protein